jgi:hypothetical protein
MSLQSIHAILPIYLQVQEQGKLNKQCGTVKRKES